MRASMQDPLACSTMKPAAFQECNRRLMTQADHALFQKSLLKTVKSGQAPPASGAVYSAGPPSPSL